MSDILITSQPSGEKQAIGNSREFAARGMADWLCLAAAPTFALMALLTALGDGEPNILCAVTQHSSTFGGMTLMYLLMAAFHSTSWSKLICGR